MQEIWKPIKNYESKHLISNCGNVKSLNYKNRGYSKILCLKKHNKGYFQVELSKNGKTKTFLVHRLVAEAFIPNYNNMPFINHIDFNRKNNNVNNLEWCNQSQNMLHSANGEKKPISTIKINHLKKPKVRKRNEKIIQYDLKNKKIKEWEFIAQIKKELNYHPTSIYECCINKRKTAYGYKWQFAI